MKILRNIFFALSLIALVSCDETKEYPWNPEWDQNVPEQEQPENPGESETPETPGTPEEPEVKEGKARLVWIDAAANFADYANSQAKIA